MKVSTYKYDPRVNLTRIKIIILKHDRFITRWENIQKKKINRINPIKKKYTNQYI
jgi:hypothetical protein